MKFFAVLSVIVPAVLAVVPTSTIKRDFASINPDLESLRPQSAPAPSDIVPETNAKRMARGLPPLAPHKFRRLSRTAHALRPRQSSTPPVQYSGILQAIDTSGNPIGYLSTTQNIFGEYELTSTATSAAPVSFSASSDDGLFAINDPIGSTSFPLLGGIVGFANNDNNIGPGSYQYSYLGGVNSSPQGPAQPQANTFSAASGLDEPTESIIWAFDPSTSTLSPQWTNDDGSQPTTYLLSTQGFFVLTGDINAFSNTFGPGSTQISFKLVQPAV